MKKSLNFCCFILFVYSFLDWLVDMKYYSQFDNESEENFEVVSSSNPNTNKNILESSDEEENHIQNKF